MAGVYHKVIGSHANVARMNFVNAELTKISINTYVTMKISFANTLGEICDRLEGADVPSSPMPSDRDTRSARNISNLPSAMAGPAFRVTLWPFHVRRFGRWLGGPGVTTDKINRRQFPDLTKRARDLFQPAGIVCILGLSYKPNTPVVEESQGIMLAQSLYDASFDVVVTIHCRRPAQAVLGNAVRLAPTAREAVTMSDIVIIMTPWPEYAEISPNGSGMTVPFVIIDCWRQLASTIFERHCQVVHPLGPSGDDFCGRGACGCGVNMASDVAEAANEFFLALSSRISAYRLLRSERRSRGPRIQSGQTSSSHGGAMHRMLR